MKKLTSILLIAMMILSTGTLGAFANDEIEIIVNGNAIEFDVAPFVENKRVLVPVRAIFEALGAQVYWNQKESSVIASTPSDTVCVYLGKNELNVNDSTYTIDVPAKAVDGRIFVPLRAVSEAFDCDVNWNQDTGTVNVKSKNCPVEFVYVNESVSRETTTGQATITANYTYPKITDGGDFISDEMVAKLNEEAKYITLNIISFEDYVDTFEEDWQVIIQNGLFGSPNITHNFRTTIELSEKYGTVSYTTDVEMPWTGKEMYSSTFDVETMAQKKTIGETLKLSTQEECTKVYDELFNEFQNTYDDIRYGRERFDDPEPYSMIFTVSGDRVTVYLSSIIATGVGRVNGYFSISKRY